MAIKAKHDPLLVTAHDTLDDLRSEYETSGYWYLASRGTAAKVLALRFNLEEAPENDFAVAIADRKDQALASVAAFSSQTKAASRGAALDAMADIMGWNTIWDGVNHRSYITCSRNWDLKKFGGFGFWLNDTAKDCGAVEARSHADRIQMCCSSVEPMQRSR